MTNSFEEETVEFSSKREQELYAMAVLGERARDFFNSEAGRYVVGCAAQEIEFAANELLKTPSWNKRKIQRLQLKAKAAEAGIKWLREAVSAGEYAHNQLLDD